MELLSGYDFYSVPPPGSGPILAFILKLVEDTLPKNEKLPETTSIITEAFKYAYAMRSWLGDPHFIDNSKVKGNWYFLLFLFKGYAQSRNRLEFVK